MKQLVQYFKDGEIVMEDVPAPVIREGGILVQTMYSAISPGTEKMMVELGKKNYLGKAVQRPDIAKQVMDKVKNEGIVSTYKNVMNRMDAPVTMGYSCAGRVIGVGTGVSDVEVGDYVACAGVGYANHAQINFVPQNLFVKVQDQQKIEQMAYVALGAIGIHSVRQAEVQLGETVAVIGLGLVGQITGQVLKAAGCRVVGIDIDPYKVDVAVKGGIDKGIVLGKGDSIKGIMGFTQGLGVDKIIITASAQDNGPVELAAQIARDRATIVMVGVTSMNLPRDPYYKKELNFVFSRSYGPGRYDYSYEHKGIDYPIGYVRWTEGRNMQEFVRLVQQGDLDLKSITTHVLDFEDARQAYQLLNEVHIGILLKYQCEQAGKEDCIIMDTKVNFDRNTEYIGIGLIGAGNFTQSILMPNFKKIDGIRWIGVASAGGLTAKSMADKYGFEYATTDYMKIIEDKSIDLCIITCPHNLHYQMVKNAVINGKHVYVEKPLCIHRW
ncbi:MAG: Gfo/Idh/MocA family oxidoreductase [Clostridia bacterium]|nr:Gfo/Idh/MocA family oxidoreductase [Clostridia bacterium]